MSWGGICNIFMMVSLLLRPLGSETLLTMERRREKRNSFAIGNKQKKYYHFSTPFAKNMEWNFICSRECVGYLQKRLYILCLVTCNKCYQMHSWECKFLKKYFFHLEFSFTFNASSFWVPWQPEPWKSVLCVNQGHLIIVTNLPVYYLFVIFLASLDHICSLSALACSFPGLLSWAAHGGQGCNLCPEPVSPGCSGKGISSEHICLGNCQGNHHTPFLKDRWNCKAVEIWKLHTRSQRQQRTCSPPTCVC